MPPILPEAAYVSFGTNYYKLANYFIKYRTYNKKQHVISYSVPSYVSLLKAEVNCLKTDRILLSSLVCVSV